MSQTPDQPKTQKSVDDLVPYEETFGVAHAQLGFEGIERTAKFLQSLIGMQLITFRLLEKDQAQADESQVMKTQELTPKLRKTTKVRARLTPEEIRSYGWADSLEHFMRIADRLRFNSQEIISFIPLAKDVQQTEGMTVEQYFDREKHKLAEMRAQSRNRSLLKAVTRSCLFRLLAIGAVAGGVAYSQYPKYMPWLEEMIEKISHISPSPETAPVTSSSGTEPGETGVIDSSTSVAPPTSSAPLVPPNPESDLNERRREVGIRMAKRWLQNELNPESLTRQHCEEEIRALASTDQNGAQGALLAEWNEKLTVLIIIEELERILGKIERKERVESSEIEAIVNPNRLKLEDLNVLQEKWQKPELASHPEQRQNLERLARLKRVIAAGEVVRRLLHQ